MPCSLSGSSVHVILQARILELVTIPFPGNLHDPETEPRFSAFQADSLLSEPPGKLTRKRNIRSDQISHSPVSDSLGPYESQHSRPPCPSPTPRVYPNMSIESVMPSNHLISVIPFSSCLQSFPISGSFQVSQLFSSVGQNTGVSALTSVLPMNTQDRFPLGGTGWVFL